MHRPGSSRVGGRVAEADTTSPVWNVIPTPTQAFILWQLYCENVAPVIPLLHKPSIYNLLMDSASVGDSLDSVTKSLLLAVCLSAVVTMTSAQCLHDLGVSLPSIVRCYKEVLQYALNDAKLWSTRSTTVLQAAALYVTAIRNHTEDPAYVWALLTVIIRRARSAGLHRDPAALGVSPFEVEMRRRLWWHLCLLDQRASEDQGTSPELLSVPFNVRLPLNVNDDDILPTSTLPVQERIGVTDMTFANIRYESIRAVWGMRRELEYRRCSPHTQCSCIDMCSETSARLLSRLHRDYISHFSPDHPLVRWYVGIARVVPKVTFVIHHPFSRDQMTDLPLDLLDEFFMTAVEAVEFCRFIETCTLTAKWRWHFRQSSTRWHLLTFLLTELCVRPPCPSVDRAWLAVSAAYREWDLAVAGKEWQTVSALMEHAASIRNSSSEL